MNRNKIIVGAIATVVGFSVGAIGASSDTEPTTTAKPETVVKTVEAEPEVVTETETVEVEVTRTPDACVVALDTAEEALSLSAESMGIASDAIGAAGSFDLAGITEATDGFKSVNRRLTPLVNRYNTASMKCRLSN